MKFEFYDKDARGVFKKPKMRVYFGFWATPRLARPIMNWLNAHTDEPSNIIEKAQLYCMQFLGKVFNSEDGNLPVWRHGYLIRPFKKHQKYIYNNTFSGYIWTEDCG